MQFAWIKETIEKVEAATWALEETLSRDDPDRQKRTQYTFPKQEYICSCLRHAREACRSVLLNCRLVQAHFDLPASQLTSIDLPTLSVEQEMWQRKMSEILCNLINIEPLGDNYFKLFLLRDKAEGRQKLSQEMEKIYGSKTKMLDVFCLNDADAFESLKQQLPESKIAAWSAETSVNKALEKSSDSEKYAIGQYLNYRVRSGSIHFSTFPKDRHVVDFDLFLHYLTLTTLLVQFITVRSARMFPLIISEVAALSSPEVMKIFEESFATFLDPKIEINDEVNVVVHGKEQEATVIEIRTGLLGGKSYKVQPKNPRAGWNAPSDFHSAMFVRKKAT